MSAPESGIHGYLVTHGHAEGSFLQRYFRQAHAIDDFTEPFAGLVVRHVVIKAALQKFQDLFLGIDSRQFPTQLGMPPELSSQEDPVAPATLLKGP